MGWGGGRSDTNRSTLTVPGLPDGVVRDVEGFEVVQPL